MKRKTPVAPARSVSKITPVEGKPLFESLESRQLLSATSSVVAEPSLTIMTDAVNSTMVGMTASEIRAAYGITGTGAGQTIAIVDAYNDPTIQADLKAFDKAMGLSDTTLSVVSQTGSSTSLPANDAGWALEIALDVEWAHAVAPGAKIMLVEAKSDSFSDLLTAVNYARNAAGVSVVSMSWGASEFYGETSYDSYFTTPSGHISETFIAASGDEGYVTWPSVSANVLAVGGTTLSVTSTGTYTSESGWADSGGGYSRYETEPTYQRTVQTTGVRTTPDVSYDANPSTGFAVYDTTAYSGQSGWLEIGGTSAGAPQWAGLVAIADAARTAAGYASLATSNVLSALYTAYSTATSYSSDFHDVTTGSSGGGGFFGRGFGGGKSATTGYDLLTGLGSPKAAGVLATLSSSTATAAVTTTISSTTTTTTTTTSPTNTNTNPPPSRHRYNGPFDEIGGSDSDIQVGINVGGSYVLDGQQVLMAGEGGVGSAMSGEANGGAANSIGDADGAINPNALLSFDRGASMAAAIGVERIGREMFAGVNGGSSGAAAGTSSAFASANVPLISLTTAAGSISAQVVNAMASEFLPTLTADLRAAVPAASIIGATLDRFTTQVPLEAGSTSWPFTAAAAALAGAIGFSWWWSDSERECKKQQQPQKKTNPFASSKLIQAGPLY